MTIALLAIALMAPMAILILMPLLKSLFARRTGHTEPTCGQCGYCVNGLTIMVCPECGSDLRVAGIETHHQQMSSRNERLKSAFALTGLIGMWAVPLGLIYPCLPMLIRLHGQQTLSNPASGAYRQICIDTSGSSWAPRPPDLSIDISLTRLDGQTATLRLVSNPVIREARSRQPLSAELLSQWLGQNGIESEQASVKQETTEVLHSVLKMTMPAALSANTSGSHTSGIRGPSNGTFSIGAQSSQASMQPPPGLTWTAQVLWLLLFPAGVIWIWPRRHNPSANSGPAAPVNSA